MKRIVFITNSISFGGAAKMLCHLAETLSDRGHAVCIINRSATNNATDYERALKERITLYRIEAKNRIGEIIQIMQYTKHFRGEIIIGFTSFPNLCAVIVGKLLGIPSIISERGDPNYTKGRNRIKTYVVDKIINLSKGGVFQTEGARDYYGKGLKVRGKIIPNPIFMTDDLPERDYQSCEKTVVSVGRLDNFQKRYDVLIRAFSVFSKEHPEYVLKLYGRGNDEIKIKKWIKDEHLENRVLFMGLTTNPMKAIANEGIFIITSDFEGISNSLLEAMAVGLPCVSTDHSPGGARLLIQDHINGLLAPVGDSDALACALSEFANSTELSMKCGIKAKEVLERFKDERIMDMWESYIYELCGE